MVMNDYVTLWGFILTVLLVGISVGKFVERIERFIHKREDEDKSTQTKNNRR